MRTRKKRPTRYIIITGGVISGLGKGVAAASLGACLKARKLKIGLQKFDMYLNVDAGTLKPGQHGEVYVTQDGGETDLDLGHYERFLDTKLKRQNSIMQGAILNEVIAKERAGDFLGDDVQVMPHLTNIIQQKIIELGKKSDIHIVELGGTVGDYESLAFIEAAHQLALRVGRENILYIHVVYLPYLQTSGEVKTKPAQNSIRNLRAGGIMADFIFARCEQEVNHAYLRNKFHLFSSIPQNKIAILENSKSVYQVPLVLEKQGIIDQIVNFWQLPQKATLSIWQDINHRVLKKYTHKIRIGLVLKYLDNKDTYKSLIEALQINSWYAEVELDLNVIDANQLSSLSEDELEKTLQDYDGFLIPGGFGERGIEGMILVADYALKNNIPYFGICLGMQILVIAFARANGLSEANSQEFNPAARQLVIIYLPEQENIKRLGGTMRLGAYPCLLKQGSLARQLYGVSKIFGRHRHRFEFNSFYQQQLESSGLLVSGICPDNQLVEIVEIPKHPYALGCQFHPEFDARPMRAYPLFKGFLKAALKYSKSK